MDILEKLNWRYATKVMTEEIVPQHKMDTILEAARLAPTSSGLQPYEIFVITNSELKDKIQKIAYDQQVVGQCSHLLVFAAWDNYTEERINYMFDLTNKIRGNTTEYWEAYRQKLLNFYPHRDSETNFEHIARQAYLGFMTAIMAAAFEGVDATPIEGFENDDLDELLGLREKGLRSTTLLTLGYRDIEKDWLVNQKKVRRSKEEFITYIK